MQQTLGRGRKVIDIQQKLEATKDMEHDHFCREGRDMFSEKEKQGHGGRKGERGEDLRKG